MRSVFGFGSAEDRESAERIGSGLENAVGVLVRAEEARRYVATTTILKRFTAATPTLLFHVLFFFLFKGWSSDEVGEREKSWACDIGDVGRGYGQSAGILGGHGVGETEDPTERLPCLYGSLFSTDGPGYLECAGG